LEFPGFSLTPNPSGTPLIPPYERGEDTGRSLLFMERGGNSLLFPFSLDGRRG